MIVLDEQLADPQIIRSIEQWYKGKVIVIGEARPQTRITDDVIPALLRRLKAPTFVTINYEDFWRKIPANSAYCVICFKLTGKRSAEVPGALRAILSRPEWRSKSGRLGTVISVSARRVVFYSAKQQHIGLVT
jgi:hypothetical protein